MKTSIIVAITAALLGGQTATFERAAPRPSNLIGYVSGDFNGDGRLDLVGIVNYREFAIFLGAADGGFEDGRLFSVERDAGWPGAAADFNRDGHLDLLVLNEHSDDASTLLGDGAGNFEAATQFATGRYPDSAAVADFDGDGRLDFATANVFGDSLSVMLNRTPARPSKSWLAALQTAINGEHHSTFHRAHKAQLLERNRGLFAARCPHRDPLGAGKGIAGAS